MDTFLLDDVHTSPLFQVSFSVSYTMSLSQYEDDIAIAVGVLSAFALVYSFVQTWCWSKRTGRIAIDFITLVKFVVYVIGNLANVFFVVMFGASLWWLIFYKVSEYTIIPDTRPNQ